MTANYHSATSGDSPPVPRTRARFAFAYAACWVPIGVLYGIVVMLQTGQFAAALAVRVGMENAITPALMGLGVWYLSRRYEWPEGRIWPFAVVHLLLSLVFGLTWTVSVYVLMGEAGRARMSEYVLWHIVLPWQSVFGVFLYGLVAGVSYALRAVTRSRDLRILAERAERLRAQAELSALRAHINPHFLFNTLHTVTQLLRGDPARAEAALEHLSELFRYALRLDRQRVELVSLEDEWQFVESYLWLEQLRMGERLRVDASLDDEALACAVPPFTLQPLVENAIRHGIGPAHSGGTLIVRAAERNGILEIEVRDDGAGADAAAVANDAGLGVRAVRQRIEARHGTRATAHVTSEIGKGFRVVLSFPAEAVPGTAPRAPGAAGAPA